MSAEGAQLCYEGARVGFRHVSVSSARCGLCDPGMMFRARTLSVTVVSRLHRRERQAATELLKLGLSATARWL